MSILELHITSMRKRLPVSVKANFGSAEVKRSGRSQNRQLKRGKGAGAVQ